MDIEIKMHIMRRLAAVLIAWAVLLGSPSAQTIAYSVSDARSTSLGNRVPHYHSQ